MELWEAVFVDAVTVRVAELFVGGAIAFDRSLMDGGIVLLSGGHGRHDGPPSRNWLR